MNCDDLLRDHFEDKRIHLNLLKKDLGRSVSTADNYSGTRGKYFNS